MARDARKVKEEATRALDKGKFKKALECYLELERLEPGDGAWSRRAADMYRRLGQEAGYVASLQRAADRYARAGFLVKAVAVCKMILQAEPEHTEALRRLAELNAERGIPPARRPAADRAGQERLVPAGAALEAVPLAEVVPDARPQPLPDGTASGITEIPLELELDLEEALAELPPSSPPPPAPDDEQVRAARRQRAQALHATPLLSALPPASLQQLIERVRLIELAPGAAVFREGDRGGHALYVVAEGEVAVISEGPPRVRLSTLAEGSFFGEIAVVTEEPRSATIEAMEPTQLLEIGRDVLSDLIEREPQVLKVLLGFLRERLVHRLAHTSPLFGPFGGDEAVELAERFRLLECAEGATLIEQGARSPGLYVLLSGHAQVVRTEEGGPRRLATLGPGDLCGEMSLLTQEPAVATVTLTRKALVLELPAPVFRELIMTHPQVLAFVGDLADERRRALEAIAGGDADYREPHLDLF